jgi:hypothetical protein
MKQREDNKTIDMFGNEPKPTTYRFYIETSGGESVWWTGLTLTKAKQMYAYTDQTQPSNVTGYGWEATK